MGGAILIVICVDRQSEFSTAESDLQVPLRLPVALVHVRASGILTASTSRLPAGPPGIVTQSSRSTCSASLPLTVTRSALCRQSVTITVIAWALPAAP